MPIQPQAARQHENFPVASWLLPAPARAAVRAFYDFARGADDLADAPDVPAGQRRDALIELRQAVIARDTTQAPDWAHAYIALLDAGRLPPAHGEALLHAFIQDTQQSRYADYAALLDYCRHSAAPVGRAMLALCGESQADEQAADALCIALQLLNHLQDIKADYTARQRIYLPQDWLMDAAVAEPELAGTRCTPGLRQVIGRLLTACEALTDQAAALPASLQSRRLRMEIGVIRQVARRLAGRLRTRDPLAERVVLSRADYAYCLFYGLREGL